AATPAQTPVRDRARPVVGTGSLSGRVVDAVSGEPVRKVRVRAVDPEVLPKGRGTLTDVNGFFTLKALPAGHYMVLAAKAAYVPTAYGQPTPIDQPALITLAEGQTLDRITVTLAHGGVIAGRITDEFGDPITHVTVSVEQRAFAEDGQLHAVTA